MMLASGKAALRAAATASAQVPLLLRPSPLRYHHVVVVAEPQHQLTAQVFAVEVAVSLENLSTSNIWRWRWRSA